MTKKKLLIQANVLALHAILARDAIQEGPKNFQEKDRILKYLERIERLLSKIRAAVMGV